MRATTITAAAALFLTMLGGSAAAQTACARDARPCAAACAELCGGSEVCAACAADAACVAAEAACAADGDRVPLSGAPAPAPQIAGAVGTPSLAPRVLFLMGRFEPPAAYYGYLAIGAEVDDARREAVARALGCAVETFGADAPAPDGLALIALPSLGPGPDPAAGDGATPPREILDLYDAVRGQRWLRAAGYALGERFDADRAVLFIGSRRPRAQQLDSVALAAVDPNDPVFADASGLEPSGLEAWTASIIEGVRSGAVRSRQDYQAWMETYAWVEWASSPITGLFTVSRAFAAPPIECG